RCLISKRILDRQKSGPVIRFTLFFVFVYVFPNWPGALLKISSMGEKINVFYKRIKYILCYKRGKKIKVTEKLFGKRTQKIKIIRRKFEWM
ncbi:hypothetical protein, partial [Paenibacillus larvae]|uniref:hypothetical protein n=1 Tax=Paenibacillus larvae TaxID=1464 RepID=UPI00288E837B